MGHRGLVVMVVVLASCTTPQPGQLDLLPPTQDAATGAPPTRRPGDPQASGAVDSGPPADGGGPAEISTDAPPDTARAPAADAETPATPDTSQNLPDAPPAPAADADGVTWDANQKITDCGITKPWAPKTSYAKYEFALNYGHIFQCLGEPPYRLDCKSPDYEPGKPGGPWMEAWFDSGVCR